MSVFALLKKSEITMDHFECSILIYSEYIRVKDICIIISTVFIYEIESKVLHLTLVYYVFSIIKSENHILHLYKKR